MNTCPTCGGQIAPLTLAICRQSNVVTRFGQTAKLTPAQTVLLRLLVDRYPCAVTVNAMASKLWGGSHGPEGEGDVIRTHLAKMRKRLVPLGMYILCCYNTGYRLILEDLHVMQEVA
jgi:DNA-binding response OmpR family regulator